MNITAEAWKRPGPKQIAAMVDMSGYTQPEVSARSGVGIDRLKRLMGRKASGHPRQGVKPISYGEWLALLVATAPSRWGDEPHPLTEAVDAAAHRLDCVKITTTEETP